MEFKYGQWTLTADGEGYKFVNIGEDGGERFYRVEPGKYGQPLIIAEPTLAFDAPNGLNYVNHVDEATNPVEKIAGIICQNGPRFSLSNAQKQGIVVSVNADGSIQIGSETWWLATLFSKDKYRIVGYDAYLVREKPERVRVIELGDLDLF